MARVTLSSFVSSIKGSINGSTFQNSAYGQIIRNKPIPSKSSNNAQANIKLIQSQLNYNWAALTSAQRAAWDGKINQQFRTGKQAYLNANFYLIFKGQTVINVPAYNVLPSPIIATQLILNLGELFLICDFNADMGVNQILIKASYPCGNTVVRAKKNMRLLLQDTADSLSTVITPIYENTLNVSPVVGMQLYISTALQNLTSGDVGAWSTILMQVTAP